MRNLCPLCSLHQDSFRANATYLYADSRGVARRLVVTRGIDVIRLLMAQYITERGLQAWRAIAVLHEVAFIALNHREQLRHPKPERVRPAWMVVALIGSHSWASFALLISVFFRYSNYVQREKNLIGLTLSLLRVVSSIWLSTWKRLAAGRGVLSVRNKYATCPTDSPRTTWWNIHPEEILSVIKRA